MFKLMTSVLYKTVLDDKEKVIYKISCRGYYFLYTDRSNCKILGFGTKKVNCGFMAPVACIGIAINEAGSKKSSFPGTNLSRLTIAIFYVSIPLLCIWPRPV